MDAPADFPAFAEWTATVNGKLATVGNNVRALNGTTRKPYEIAAADSGGIFAPDPDSPEQFISNIFYFCNYVHDFFLMQGPSEESGNFQTTNPSGMGRGALHVDALAHPGRVFGTANMSTRADGVSALMNMGLVTSTGRHTANDSDVVFHEYVHGVTNRLVGGMLDAEGLNEEQSVAMGEVWSDFFALTINNFPGTRERLVTESWVTGRESGIRQRPYDAQYPAVCKLEAGAVLQFGRADLERPEFIQVQGLEPVQVLCQQEGVAPEGALPDVRTDLPVLPGQPDAAVLAVIVLEHRSAENADFQVLHVDVGENRFIQPPPHPVLAALVEVVHVWRDVGEE